ncbi:MAG: NAD(P)(+) transhydrogenase (Re/Si-specific) subunit alpha, partial [Gemmatimonadota bacterium]
VVKEQVESLGATFVGLDLAAEETETAGGYAKEVGEDVKKREHERIHEQVKAADVVITAAQVPGKRAPVLITEAMLRDMSPGSVVVDLAAETGGNCELTKAGERVERHDVILHGPVGLPSRLPLHASQMYSRNISSLLQHLMKDGRPHLDFDDPIVSETCVAHDGRLLHGAPAGAKTS